MTKPPQLEPLPDGNDAAVGFVLRLARAMQAYGYPAHRVEYALGEVARRLGLTAQFFSTPTSFMASFGSLEHQRTHLIRVEPGDVDLGKSADVEAVIREVVEGRATPAQGSADLERIHAAPPRYGAITTVLAFGFSSSAASRFLGGGLREALVAGVIGLVIGVLGVLAGRLPALGRVFPFLAAFSASAIAAAAATVLRALQRLRRHAGGPHRADPRTHAHHGDDRALLGTPRERDGAPERRAHALPGHRLRRGNGEPARHAHAGRLRKPRPSRGACPTGPGGWP